MCEHESLTSDAGSVSRLSSCCQVQSQSLAPYMTLGHRVVRSASSLANEDPRELRSV